MSSKKENKKFYCEGIDKLNFAQKCFNQCDECAELKKDHGGKREGAGRKTKPYKQKQMGIRVPDDIFQDCINACNILTKKYEKKLEKSLRNQK